jgi:hypothetical protein
MVAVHSLKCRCKAKRCQVCQMCSRCGCDHDGVPIEMKMVRMRGQPSRRQLQMSDNDESSIQHPLRDNNLTFFSPPPLTPHLFHPFSK